MTMTLSPRQSVFIAAAVYALAIIALSLIYLAQASSAGGGLPLMPVDDAYIHFQYARQAADGQPFVYNPGQGATSGATSLLYPFVLAGGYKLGFTGLSLGYWAYVIGGLALFASALTVRAIGRAAGLTHWLHDGLGLAVALWGTLVWHAFSGMETALVVAFALLTFHAFERGHLRGFALSAAMLAVLRPEASLMAVMAAAIYALRDLRAGGRRRAQLWLLLPVAAAAIQPLVNLIVVGSASAAGGQAKSLLGIVPFDFDYIFGRVRENYLNAWRMFVTGIAPDGVFVLPPLLGAAALLGLVQIARKRPLVALLPLAWLAVIFGAISTLDTAFWHFNRYHMPLLALAFPLAAYAVALVPEKRRNLAIGYMLVAGVLLNVIYIGLHRVNVESVAEQPLKMAYWLAENTPPDSLIAVHDVGLMRYLGGRETLDMVGLTTVGASDAWRNGPGAVGEYLVNAPRRPDYFAAYTDARGLSYLADSLYGETLAEFPHDFDLRTNVALGGDFQGIFQPDWAGADAALEPRIDAVRAYITGATLTDTLNVAQLSDEQAHDYAWENVSRFDGFASEMYQLDTPGCVSDCRILDGGRRLNGAESFALSGLPSQDHILISRFHAPDGGKIRVTVNDAYRVERTLPALPGQFIEIPTLIPARLIASDSIEIRIEPVESGALIYPYRHWLYAVGEYEAVIPPNPPVSFQDGSVGLSVTPNPDGDSIIVNLRWSTDGTAAGDYVAFVHVYGDLDAPPVLQSDIRPAGGALPPGAWLAGVISDRIVLDLGELPEGTYTLAVGLYAPLTFERLEPSVRGGDYPISERRVLVRTIEIPAE